MGDHRKNLDNLRFHYLRTVAQLRVASHLTAAAGLATGCG